MKYKGRKKYTPEEAGKQMENTAQMLCVNRECLFYWHNKPRDYSDKLIEVLCHQTREEMIEQAEEQNEFLNSKFEYMRQFNPDYRLKGSFGL